MLMLSALLKKKTKILEFSEVCKRMKRKREKWEIDPAWLKLFGQKKPDNFPSSRNWRNHLLISHNRVRVDRQDVMNQI